MKVKKLIAPLICAMCLGGCELSNSYEEALEIVKTQNVLSNNLSETEKEFAINIITNTDLMCASNDCTPKILSEGYQQAQKLATSKDTSLEKIGNEHLIKYENLASDLDEESSYNSLISLAIIAIPSVLFFIYVFFISPRI